LARAEAVVVIVAVRIEPLLHRRDRDGIEAGIAALVVRLAGREDLLRGQGILFRGVVLNDADARRRACEWIAGGILELREPLHVGRLCGRRRGGRRRRAEAAVSRTAAQDETADRDGEDQTDHHDDGLTETLRGRVHSCAHNPRTPCRTSTRSLRYATPSSTNASACPRRRASRTASLSSRRSR